MTYPIISTDVARLRTIDGQEGVYIGPVHKYQTYAEWEGQIVTLRDELGEIEVDARLIRHIVGENNRERDQWIGILVSPYRDYFEQTTSAQAGA